MLRSSYYAELTADEGDLAGLGRRPLCQIYNVCGIRPMRLSACSARPKLAPSLDDGFFFVNWRVFLVSEKIEVRYSLEVTEVRYFPKTL
jgi:hypothetical protein